MNEARSCAASESGQERRAIKRLLGLGCSIFFGALASCDLSTEGFEGLVDPNPSFVMFPGTRIAAGSYHQLVIDGTDREGGHLLALDDESKLTIAALDGSGTCSPGPAEAFSPFSRTFGREVRFDAWLPFLSNIDATGRGTLNFTRFDCQKANLAVTQSALPHNGFFKPLEPGFITLSDTGLWLHDPWKSSSTQISERADTLQTSLGHLWTIEDGRLMVTDRKLERTELALDVQRLAVVQPFEEKAAFIDSSGLKLVSSNGELVPIDEQACNLMYPIEGFSIKGFGYFSPCDERQLVLYELDTGERHVLGPGVGGVPLLRQNYDKTYVFYVTDADTKGVVGTLWAAELGGVPERIGERGHLRRIGYPVANRVLLILDFDGQKGTLVDWRPGQGVTEVAHGVTDLHEPFALADFDGQTGTLIRVRPDSTVDRLASGVPEISNTARSQPVFLEDFDGSTGTLSWFDAGKVKPIAEAVRFGTYGFLYQAPAVGYLRDYSTERGAGTFVVKFVETGTTFDVKQPVNQWGELGWPDPGLIYNVSSGPSQGVWFAKLP